jgi:protein-tyrosine-phosphatase
MAMAILRQRLDAARMGHHYSVESAGYHDWDPFPREAHPFARRAVTELLGGDSLADHVARRWTPAMIAAPTRIVVAEEWMRSDFPRERVASMRELAGEDGDVPDPYGSDYPVYTQCAREIGRLIDAGMAWLTGPAAAGT